MRDFNTAKLNSLITPLIFTLFIVLHVVLINVNFAEWGDSYRILRASNYVRNLSYPADEKRPPLFSVVLAVRPAGFDAVEWGRLFMLVDSIVAFFIFYKLCGILLSKEKHKLTITNLALVLYALNPVIFYWSLRIYADVPLLTLVMLSFYLLYEKREVLSFARVALLGVLAGLAVMTRFEGYLLFGSVACGILFFKYTKTDAKHLVVWVSSKIPQLLVYFGTFVLTILPYLYFRNPLTSSYFEEVSSMSYDLKAFLTYISSLIFIFGFVFGLAFLTGCYKKVLVFFAENIGIFAFVALELLLILVWPAAIPRLFVQTIPFLIIPLALCLKNYLDVPHVNKNKAGFLAAQVLLLVIYVAAQYYYKQQFLIVVKPVFAFIIGVQVLLIVFSALKMQKVFYCLIIISCLSWTLSTVWIHRDIYRTIKTAAVIYENKTSKFIFHNDPNGVADWYLNGKGVYCDTSQNPDNLHNCLRKLNVDYVLLTNEANPGFSIDIGKFPELQQVETFNYFINGHEFSTVIYRTRLAFLSYNESL